MSDNEMEIVPEVEETIQDVSQAIRKVLKIARSKDGLARGIHEVIKALEHNQVKVLFLAKSINEDAYKNLIIALAQEKNVKVIDVSDNKTLGEWAGLCKIDKDGQARKVVGASVVAVVNFGEESMALNYLKAHTGF
jgi:small subunit ribosomal protein S12e